MEQTSPKGENTKNKKERKKKKKESYLRYTISMYSYRMHRYLCPGCRKSIIYLQTVHTLVITFMFSREFLSTPLLKHFANYFTQNVIRIITLMQNE